MRAYLIANIDVHDADAYQAYRSRTGAIVERHGGRFIVRGGNIHPLEGEAWARRLVIIEFPDLEAANSFYTSEGYQEVIPLRTCASEGSLLIVEGVD